MESNLIKNLSDANSCLYPDTNNSHVVGCSHPYRPIQGIDAPERKQAYGKKSKEYLSVSVAGRFVVVEYDKKDRYGRIVGKVLVGGKDACLEQIRAGLAWHYKKYQKEQTESDRLLYSKAEDEAREAKRGLWQDPHAVAPWEYRAAKRK